MSDTETKSDPRARAGLAHWNSIDDLPDGARESLAAFSEVTGRDPVAAQGFFLDGANDPASLAAARGLPGVTAKHWDLEQIEEYRSGKRVAAGWRKLLDQFPKEARIWQSNRLEKSKADRDRRKAEEGPALFAELIERIRAHYYFEKDWHYTVCALFVMQSWVVRAGALPAVFYLYFGGSMSSGKSSILFLVSSLSDGIMLENVSPSALARVIGDGRTVLLDEFDVERGEELDDVMASLLRSGYRRNGPPYVRWNAKDKQAEILSIFGPKCGTFRSSLDPALQSRGFVIPTAKPVGEEHFGLVLASWWPKTSELVPKLKAWGKWAASAWNAEKLEETARSGVFQAKLRTIVGQLGANRESELLTLALLVAEMVPVSVVDSLASARELRAVEISEDQAEAIEEVRAAVLQVVAKTVSFSAEGREVYRVAQKTVRDHVNFLRKQRTDRPLTASRLALLRRELGVSDSWLVESGHRVVWNLPPEFVELLRKQASDSTGAGPQVGEAPPPGYSLAPPHLPSYSLPPFVLPPDSTDGRREQGSTKGVPGGGYPPDGQSSTGAGQSGSGETELPEESELGTTRTDRLRSRLDSEGDQ